MTEYNGWTNYETWLVNLWIDNDEVESTYWYERARDLCERVWKNPELDWQAKSKEHARAVRMLAGEIECSFVDQATDLNGGAITGIWADLINAALSAVNWHEIAGHYYADYEDVLGGAA